MLSKTTTVLLIATLSLLVIGGCGKAVVPKELKVTVTSTPRDVKIPVAVEPGQRLSIRSMEDKILSTYTARTDRPITALYDNTTRLFTVHQGTLTRTFSMPIMWEVETLPN